MCGKKLYVCWSSTDETIFQEEMQFFSNVKIVSRFLKNELNILFYKFTAEPIRTRSHRFDQRQTSEWIISFGLNLVAQTNKIIQDFYELYKIYFSSAVFMLSLYEMNTSSICRCRSVMIQLFQLLLPYRLRHAKPMQDTCDSLRLLSEGVPVSSLLHCKNKI